jgi:hypothetical protein
MAEELAIEVSKVNSLCDKVGTTLSKLEIDSTILSVFYDLKNTVSGVCGIQERILFAGNKVNPSVTTQCSESTGMTDLGNIAKRPRQLELISQQASQPIPSVQVQTVRQQDPPTEEERIQKKFKEAVRVAENSTLVLNLDMGKVPLINKETIKKNATMALVTMAAKMEENNHTSVPCEDTIVALDDILSVVKGMEFYGKKTKTYNNPKDKLSGSYCTIPVKYEFRSKEEKIEAETLMMNKCGANCSTPYPAILRECIKQVVNKVRSDFPNNQVKVSVETNTFSLRVSRREKVKGTPNRWTVFTKNVPLPIEALNVDARQVPEGFIMPFLPPGPDLGTSASPVRNGPLAQAESGTNRSSQMESGSENDI